MNYLYLVSKTFSKSFKRLAKKYPSLKFDFEKFKKEFENNTNVGVDLGEGFRKIRVSIQSKGKGKSGGARIITYEVVDVCLHLSGDKNILLIDIYDKSEKETMTDKEYKEIAEDFFENNEKSDLI